MSEQIREQVSAFLDGELPSSETELLLKRLTRDADLRESFGRYALIGEALRGTSRSGLSKGFTARVNLAIDGEIVPIPAAASRMSIPRWWKPLAGAAVVAGVAAVAVVALQQRAISPGGKAPLAASASNAPAHQIVASANPMLASYPEPGQSREALSYTVPAINSDAPAVMPSGRLTNYIFAHRKYSYGLGPRGALTDL